MSHPKMIEHPVSEFLIHEGRLNDLEALAALEGRLFDAEAFSRSDLRILLRHQTGFFRVAWAGDAIAGYVSAYGVSGVGYIASIAVDTPFQRKGLGARLLDMTHAEFQRRGASAMKLHVRASNAPAIALYRKHGYLTERVIPDYYGPRAPGLLMSLAFAR